MAGFIYYIPGRTTPIPHADRIPEECELRDIFKDTAIDHGVTEHGPDGGMGLLFCVEGKQTTHCEADPKKRAELQEWTPVHGENGITHWVGWDKASPPTPQDLIRPTVCEGRPVVLGDKNEWIIPAVRAQLNTLPKVYRYSQGKFVAKNVSGYEDIVQDADHWFDVLVKIHSGESVEYSVLDILRFFADVIAINYRVGIIELTCGTDFLVDNAAKTIELFNAAFGWQYVEKELESKKAESIPPAS